MKNQELRTRIKQLMQEYADKYYDGENTTLERICGIPVDQMAELIERDYERLTAERGNVSLEAVVSHAFN